MAMIQTSWREKIATMCQTCAAMVIAGIWRRHSYADIDAKLTALPPGPRARAIGGVLGALFLLSLFAAQFGWIGMLVFWLLVILIAR